MKPSFENKDIRIIFDRDGTLTKVWKESQKCKKVTFIHEEVVNELLGYRDTILYIARHYARGQIFSAVGEIGSINSGLFHLLGKIRGYFNFELVRGAEKIISKKEWKLLNDANCKNNEVKEVRRAMKANLKLMYYVEKEYEKVSGRKLNFRVDDGGIMKKVFEILGDVE